MREGSDREQNAKLFGGLSGGRWPGLCAFRRDQSGASALEFALVAVPFVLLLFAALQVGLVYLANFTLENATNQGARLVRTGQAQNQGFDAASFKNEVCKYLSAPLSCAGLKLDVRRFANFSNAELTEPLDASGALKTNFSYDPGVGGEVVVVRAFYEFELPALLPTAISMGNMKGGSRILVATAAFRNEPFLTTSSSSH